MIRTDRIYLSLGDREEKTKNPVMAQVGNAIREGYAILQAEGMDCILEWNKGNHFAEPDLRTAKAFAWLRNRSEDHVVRRGRERIRGTIPKDGKGIRDGRIER